MSTDYDGMTLRQFREKYPWRIEQYVRLHARSAKSGPLRVISYPWFDPIDGQVYLLIECERKPEIVNAELIIREVTLDQLRRERTLPGEDRCEPVLQYHGAEYVVSYDKDERQFFVGYGQDELFTSASLDDVEKKILEVINDDLRTQR